MSKDLGDSFRREIEDDIRGMAEWLNSADQSLAIAREAIIEAFDKAAAQ